MSHRPHMSHPDDDEMMRLLETAGPSHMRAKYCDLQSRKVTAYAEQDGGVTAFVGLRVMERAMGWRGQPP